MRGRRLGLSLGQRGGLGFDGLEAELLAEGGGFELLK